VRLLAVLVVVAATLAAPARADVIDEAWKRGNDAYFRGDYPAAMAAYVELDRQGIASADLYYNLGVAAFRMGELGRSIWAFERAVALEPEAEDARFNLLQARKLAARRAVDKIEGSEGDAWWIRAVTALTVSTQTWLFLAFYFAFFLVLLLLRRLRRRGAEDLRAPLGAAAAILGLCAALGGALLLGRAALVRIPFAIVLPEEVAVKEGADPNYRTSFAIHAGLKVRLLDREQDWVRIRLANGLEGWVKDSTVGRL
jgi:tetratricopeptide (TPR) repeat protein